MKFMIYGAGVCGKRLLESFRCNPECEFVGFYDKEKSGTFMGLPISKYTDGDRTTPVIISLSDSRRAIGVLRDLRQIGYRRIYWYRGNPYDATFHGQLDDLSEYRWILPYVEMHVSDACNLNCRGCTHFSPLFHHIDADITSCLNDIRKLVRTISHIMTFRLLGGEPFLNPEIGTYVEEIRKILPETRLCIVTNGLLLPKISQKVFEHIRHAQAVIDISQYEPTHEILDRILLKLDSFGVKYTVSQYDSKQLFNKPIEIQPSGKYPQKCISDGCVNIYKGKISRCPTLMYAFKFNETFGTHLPTEGILSIDDLPSGDLLLEQLKASVPLCGHCVDNPMPWGRCKGKPTIYDFAAF